MKICLLLPSFLPDVGGLEKAADRLAGELTARRHTVVILTRDPEAARPVVDRPFPIRHYAKPASPTWWPHSIERSLRKVHAEFDFEIVCAYHPYPPGYCAVRFARRCGIPAVISCRGGDIDERSRYLKRWISRRRTIWSLRHADAVHVLSTDLGELVAALTGGQVRSHVIHNGVDLLSSRPVGRPPAEVESLQERPFILTLGRLRRFKGIHVLLDALALLLRNHVELPLVVIAGDGPARDSLEGQAREAGLTRQIRLLGEVLGQVKAWLLANCLFFVHPSLGGEGMPNSVLEAMSYGKPVVGTTIGGVTDLIHDGRGGVLVEAGNADALAAGLRLMLASDLARKGREAAEIAAAHGWEKIAADYVGLFEQLCT
jgi:glycosyltransferase involved in cell wall biosynthesis